MNERLAEMLEELIADLTDAVAAIRAERVGVALAKLDLVHARLKAASQEIRR